MTKIAILVPKLTDGGGERSASELSLALSNEGIEIFLFLYHNQITYSHQSKVVELIFQEATQWWQLPQNVLKQHRKLKKIKQEHGIDITISFLKEPNLLNIFSRNNDKIILTVHSHLTALIQTKGGLSQWINGWLVKHLYNYADVVVGISETISFDLVNNFKIDEKKVKTIYNPFDFKRIKKLAKEDLDDVYSEIFTNSIVLITVGRLADSKGQWHLIRSFKQIKNFIPNAKLVILGEGHLKDYLNQLIETLELREDVYLLGFKNNPYKYLKNADIFVFTSLYEGLPNVIVEAMCCELPIISVDLPGTREILAPCTENQPSVKKAEYHEFGVLVPTFDGKKYGAHDLLSSSEVILAEAVVELLDNKAQLTQYAEKGKKRIESFDHSTILNQWKEIFYG